MATHTYDFEPGDIAYAVINNDCVKKVMVLQYTFETYLTSSAPATVGEYVVKYDEEDATGFVTPENLFATASEALAQIDLNLMGDLSV
jgi:hypothetical protein